MRSLFHVIGALITVGALPCNARAQVGVPRAAPCSLRWTYRAPSSTYYLYPLFVSDSAGDVFWSEHNAAAEVVAVRDGKLRWRRKLGRLTFPAGGFVSASLLRANLLVVSFQSTIEGLRASDGKVVWSRDLKADLAAAKAKAGLPQETELATGAAARVGAALVTAVNSGRTPAGRSVAWLTATAPDGKLVWRTLVDGAVVRLAADGEHLYALRAEVSGDQDPIIVLPSPGAGLPIPAGMAAAVRGDEVVFDKERVVTATIGPLPNKCPPMSPSCRPTPDYLTVTAFSAGEERWHLSHPVGLVRVRLLLLNDGAVLLVENGSVARISSVGEVTPLCEFPADSLRSVVGLVDGALIVARFRSIDAYALPGAPKLAAAGWAMHGAGPAQEWSVRSAPSGAATYVPFPAGVADPATDAAYVQTDSGTTTALALADGSVRWQTRNPAKPVAIWRGHVIALEVDSSALRFAQLDPASGVEVETSQSIPVPTGLASLLIPWGGPFSCEVRIEGDRVGLRWEVMINGGSGGATIQPYGASGGADVDLASGVVSVLPTRSLEGPKPIPTPSGPLTATVGRRRFTIVYAATATLTARDLSGKVLWTRQLWSVAQNKVEQPPSAQRR